MININPSLVRNIIVKAKQLRAKEDATTTSEDNYSLEENSLPSSLQMSLYTELELLIDDLDPDQQAGLVALLWIGREDYAASEWYEVLENAMKNLSKKPSAYLLTQPLLAEYLEEGLTQMGYETLDA